MEIEAQSIDYESPRIVDYGDFAEVTQHHPVESDPHGGPHHDPRLTHSIA